MLEEVCDSTEDPDDADALLVAMVMSALFFFFFLLLRPSFFVIASRYSLRPLSTCPHLELPFALTCVHL